jgi:membrane-associated phospholipid phosphatase
VTVPVPPESRPMAGNSLTPYRFQDPYSTDDYLPAAGLLSGILLVAEVAGDSYGKGELAAMLEASIFSAVTAEGLKYAAGRERPNETLDPNDWRMSGRSFPSLHSDLAFAVGTLFAESGDDDYRWLRRFIGYGIGTATV